jgi:hypothetical protein
MQANHGVGWGSLQRFLWFRHDALRWFARTIDVIGQPSYCVFETAETFAQPLTEFGQLISAKEYKRNDSNN